MTSAYDPYHDEDISNIDIGATYTDESPFSRTLKQMGQAIKSGQFCKIQKEEETSVMKREKIVNQDTSLDMTVADDSQHEPIAIEKSVSFSEADPLIVDDSSVDDDSPALNEEFEVPEKKDESKLDEVVNEAPVVREVIEEVEEVVVQARYEPASREVIEKSSGLSLAIVVLLVGVSIGAYTHMQVSPINILSQVYTATVEHYTSIQSRLEEISGVDMPKLLFGSLSSLGALFCSKAFFADEKKLKACVEFVWGVFICSMVMTGMYFTYDFSV